MNELRARLALAGIELHPPKPGEPLETPWYIKALQALGGWVAALFIFAFLGAGFLALFQEEAAAIVIGAGMIAGACLLLRAAGNIFVEHLVLAGSLAGQGLFIVGLAGLTAHWESWLWWWILSLQALLIVIMPNYLHRVFSAFWASLALALATADLAALYISSSLVLLGVVLLWLNEFRVPGYRRAFHATAWGLLLGLLALQYMMRFNTEIFGHQHAWLGQGVGILLAGGTLAYLAYWSLQRLGGPRPSTTVYAVTALGVLVLTGLSAWAYGVTQGIAILALGFAVSHRGLTVMGVISLLFSISSYYYLLDLTLLHKSFTLAALGSLLLALRWGMAQWQRPPAEELNHA